MARHDVGESVGTPPRAKERRRHGRSVVLWGIATIAIAQVTLSFLADTIFRPYRLAVEFNDFPRQAARATQSRDYALCLGSSRLGCALPPASLNTAWKSHSCGASPLSLFLNACISAASPTTMIETYRLLRAEGAKPPRLVLVDVVPESLGRRLPVHHFLASYHMTLPEFVQSLPWNFDDDQISKSMHYRLNPAYGFRRAFVYGMTETCRRWIEPSESNQSNSAADLNAVLASRFVLPDRSDEQRCVATAHGVRKLRKWLRNYEPGGPSLVALDHLVAALRHDGADVILLAPPLCRAHRDLYDGRVESLFRVQIGRIEREHGCSFVDARDWIDDEFFHDNHHLGPAGAQRFVEFVVQRVLARNDDPLASSQ
jgi:hypothetical protein